MSRFGGASRERIVELNTVDLAPPARGSAPHIMVSPRTAAGLLTGSLALVILPVSGGVGVASGPFDLTLYRVIPTLGDFGKFQVFTAADYREQLILNDCSGGFGLFFSVVAAGDGRLLIGVAEQA